MRGRTITAYTAAGWAFAFATLSVFWAFGGRTGIHPLEEQASPILLLLLNLPSALAKVLLGMLVLATVQRWGHRLPTGFLNPVLWTIGLALLTYGLFGLVENNLSSDGLFGPYQPAEHWYWYFVLIWDPCFVLGGALVVGTAWYHRQTLRQPDSAPLAQEGAR